MRHQTNALLLGLGVAGLVACGSAAAVSTPLPQPVAVTLLAQPTRTKPPALPTLVPSATKIAPTTTPQPTPTETLQPATATPKPASSTPDELPIVDFVSPTATAFSNSNSTDVNAELLVMHNETRRALGLDGYAVSPQLNQAAQAQANYLATLPQPTLFGLGVRGHVGGDGSSPKDRVARTGYAAMQAEESWAYFNTPQLAYDWWVSDAFHRPQIVSAQYTQVGFGVAAHPNGGTVFVAVYAKPK